MSHSDTKPAFEVQDESNSSRKSQDLEKNQLVTDREVTDELTMQEDDLVEIRNKYPVLTTLHSFDSFLGGKIGIEAMGIDRVPEDKRHPPQILNMLFFWFSMNLTPTSFVIGALGIALGLSTNETILIAMVAAISASIPPAWAATLAPQTELRQIASARFTFGVWGTRLCSVLNVVVNLSYAVSTAIVGGQLLVAVSNDRIPQWLGILIPILASWVVAFFGIRLIHTVLRYVWIVSLVLIIAIYIHSAKFWPDTAERNTASLEGPEHIGGAFTYFSIVFGSVIAWTTMADDYYVHYPADISKKLVFALTFTGMASSLCFSIPVGALVGSAIYLHTDLTMIYDTGNVGKIIKAILTPAAWGNAACVLYFLTTIASQSVLIYSSVLSLQIIHKYLFAIPRFIWSTIIAAIVLSLAIGGRNSLSAIISNVSSMLGYYVVSFGGCLAIEHFVFRPQLSGYNAVRWRERAVLPIGIAGTYVLVSGFALAFLGMTQTWYIGPFAYMVSDYGGDVGEFIVMGNCLVFYPILRHFEIEIFGR